MAEMKEAKLDDGLRTLKDGSLVEGLAPGGKVFIVRTQPEFIRDIAPFFSNSIMMFIAMVMILTSNKFYMPVFFVYLISPTVNYFGQGDFKNISVNSTKLFEKDKRFDIPLQFFVFFELFVWIWAMVVMSEDVNPKGFWFSL